MPARAVYLLVVPGFADWEPSHAIAELRRHGRRGVHPPWRRYADAGAYVDEPAVRDRGLITASGLGDVEFATEIMTELDVLSAGDRAVWTRLFRGGRILPM